MKTFELALRKDEHVRRFEILVDAEGWRVVERADSTVVREARFSDWHRVERARRAFAVEMTTLRREGWLDAR
ncbi:MAG: hypothetical protein AB7O28_07625 [Vicinamibacterales bacterium]